MKPLFPLSLLAALVLVGCGDAETTIVEKDPIVESNDDHGHDHEGEQSNDITIDSMGRIAVSEASQNMLHIYDLDDNTKLDSMATVHSGMTLSTSADYRYATVKARQQDLVQFIDGGMWQEDHTDHLHDFEQAPAMSSFELTGSRPTHAVTHEGQLAIFNDGDSEAGTTASVQVVTDTGITAQAEPRTLEFTVNMHGVAEPRGEHLLASVRRDDAESTSDNKILPDQVGVYHWHDGEYELEQTLALTCPNLHGASQNHDYVAFGCSDGVLIAEQNGDEYIATKIANADELTDLRIGTLYGHHLSETFMGIARAHGGASSILAAVDPAAGEMEVLEWQSEVKIVSYGFSYDGMQFIVLDEQGLVTILQADSHDGHTHWELAAQVATSEQDLATMPEGLSFSMTLSQNGEYLYVADPIAQHIVQIHLADKEVEGHIELDFVPADIAWLGIADVD